MQRCGRATRRQIAFGLAAAGLQLGVGQPLSAEGDPASAFPAKPMRIVVGFGPGGGNDILARIVAQKLSERLGQPALVENKPGAGAMLATEFVAKAAPDGYTLLVGATGAMTINPAVYSRLRYDTVRDFVPISMLASFPLLLCVRAEVPVKSVAELVAYSQANPAQANYASSSAAFHLATELFKLKTGAPLEHIAYKSSAEMVTAVLGGEVLLALADAPAVAGQIKAGRIRALASTAAAPMPEYPEVPTMAQAGVADFEVRLWSGLFAPAATPDSIVKKLERELIEILGLPDVRERLAALAVEPGGGPGQELAARIAAEIPRWTAIAKAANIKFD
jgi:tripartite-type tricarboxylate transporter receptor subunit TctC